MRTIGQIVAFVALLSGQLCHAITLDTSSAESICQATSLIQQNIMEYYWGTVPGGTVGMFKPPYYWWVAGEVFGGMLENWYLCGDKTYENILYEGMLAQTGTNYDYMPSSQTWVEGNDDQGIWGILIMDAAERNFPAPPDSQPSWFAMAQAVFNTMNSRWDDTKCGGGLRWQIFTWNNGYNYKNTIANACLFQMAARLGRYTGNSTYLEVASKVFDWLVDIKYVILSDAANVYDGAHIETDCQNIVNQEWSYNHGVLLGACAYMYDATKGDPVWEDRVNKLLEGALSTFFNNNIMYEASCQDAIKECNDDQRTFKSLFSRMLSITAVLVPSTRDRIYPYLEASARAAAQSCVGGSKQRSCGLNWAVQGHDGKFGLGEEISSLEVIQSLLYFSKPAPLTVSTGGSDKGDPNAGLDSSTNTDIFHSSDIMHGKDRVGASLLTAACLGVFVGGALWMVF